MTTWELAILILLGTGVIALLIATAPDEDLVKQAFKRGKK